MTCIRPTYARVCALTNALTPALGTCRVIVARAPRSSAIDPAYAIIQFPILPIAMAAPDARASYFRLVKDQPPANFMLQSAVYFVL